MFWERILRDVDVYADYHQNDIIKRIKEGLQEHREYTEWKKHHFNVNHKFDFGQTLLHLATMYNCQKLVNALLKIEDIDVNIVEGRGSTPLHYACIGHNVEVVNSLLKRQDVDVNVVDNDRYAPLHRAISGNNIKIINSLLERKDIDINIADEHGNTLPHVTAKFGNAETVTTLLKTKKIGANAIDKDGCTLLHSAVQYGNVEAINVLVHAGADVNAIDKNGSTSLHYAAKDNERKIISILMLKGADPSSKDKNGNTPIDLNKNGYIKQLVEKKAVIKGLIAGCSTAISCSAIAAVLFTTDAVASESLNIPRAIVIVATLAFGASGVTYGVLKPSTKIDGAEEVQNVNGNGQNVA
ncbi:ankyrin repeat domain-containing protein [Wolbachia endosymbiont of Folsomia candida]|uniref:ankyrin repeat domain-containing protein n=1 Tax=Wolbachia endosymbiont of Folsomia candida TaxID=169402 RepID=UPI000AC64721|nr:ankyrin repeat domain-containing protein [Wolbachia endosymbiont of Folsomia candida]APR98256.1 hypothetical protein ASM33_03045 [Wolbachia endosymbiont of Folsomia candida]